MVGESQIEHVAYTLTNKLGQNWLIKLSWALLPREKIMSIDQNTYLMGQTAKNIAST